MATLQSIRNHGTILLIVVGIAMLAFILGDLLSGGGSILNSRRSQVAKIAGEKVKAEEYFNAMEQCSFAYETDFPQIKGNDAFNDIVKEDVWQTLVMKYGMQQQAEAIGMTVTEEEFSNFLFQEVPHPMLSQCSAACDINPDGSLGAFNKTKLANFIASLETEPTSPEHEALINQYKQYWGYWESKLRLAYLQEKYTSFLGSMVTANNLDAKYAFKARQEKLDVQYVQQPYMAVADDLVQVTENDIKKLYEQKKKSYKQAPNQRTRSIEYVTIPIVPSEQDLAETQALIASLENDFRTQEDVTAIINNYSSDKYTGDRSAEYIPEEFKDFAFGKKVKEGDCTEVTFNEETHTYSIARVLKSGYSKPDSVKLVAVAMGENAEDYELGWQNALGLPMENPAVDSTFTIGEQTYKITEMSPATPKVQLAILSIQTYPSAKTYDNLYKTAQQLAAANKNANALHDAAIAEGYSTTPSTIIKQSYGISNLANSYEIVKWAFAAKQGQVSGVYNCGSQYVVAAVTAINDGEFSSLESRRAELTREAINNKKAEYIINQLKGVNTLEDAAKLFDTEIKTQSSIALTDNELGTAGVEPNVIGTAFSLAPNTVSAPIKGQNGVYLLCVGEKIVAEGEFDAKQEIANLNWRTNWMAEQSPYFIPTQITNLVKEKTTIEDNRAQLQN